jgi:uncharacterized iron-regulated membrane protein
VKLRPRTHHTLWDAHAWSGVVASLPLFVMFFMGAFALFHAELDAWAQPPSRAPRGESGSEVVATNASMTTRPSLLSAGPLQPRLEQLDREHSLAGADRVAFTSESSGLRASLKQHGIYTELIASPGTGRLEPSASDLGAFLYEMHFLGPLPYGIHSSGLAAMALLLALVSGLLIHLWRLVREWFRLRPARPARTWASDLHKVWGVFGLPYQLLFAWTGAVLSIGYLTVEPVFREVAFGGDARAMSVAQGEPAVRVPAASGTNPSGAAKGEPAVCPLPDLDGLLARASELLPELRADWIGIEHVARADSTVSVYGDVDARAFGTGWVVFSASDARVLGTHGLREAGAFERFDAWFHGLHYGRFGGNAIKLLYALLALATCGVIITGNVIWLERRDPQRRELGHRLLERLSVGVCAGVVLATASMFVANRLLAALANAAALGSMASSVAIPSLEHGVFWASWLLAIALPFTGAARQRRVAGLELWVAAGAFTCAVLLDVAVRSAHGARIDEPLASLVLSGLASLAAACALGGYLLRRSPVLTAPSRARVPSSEPDAAHHEAG